MNNPYFAPPRQGHPFYRTPNYGSKNENGFMRSVVNGVGAGLCVLLLTSNSAYIELNKRIPNFMTMMEDYNTSTIVESITYIFSFLLAYLVVKVMVSIPGPAVTPWRKVSLPLSIYASFAALGCSFVGSIIIQILNNVVKESIGVEATMPEMETPNNITGYLLYFISVSILPAIFEELLFRGAVLQSLRQFGDKFAIISSALIFALAHGNLIQGINTFMMGLLIASVVVYTGSLKVGILMHFCNNFFFTLIGSMEDISGGMPEAFYGVFSISLIVMGIVGLIGLTKYKGLFSWQSGSYPASGGAKTINFVSAPMMALYILMCIGINIIYLEF